MGENDWLSPQEARLLDEEFNSVQSSMQKVRRKNRRVDPEKESNPKTN